MTLWPNHRSSLLASQNPDLKPQAKPRLWVWPPQASHFIKNMKALSHGILKSRRMGTSLTPTAAKKSDLAMRSYNAGRPKITQPSPVLSWIGTSSLSTTLWLMMTSLSVRRRPATIVMNGVLVKVLSRGTSLLLNMVTNWGRDWLTTKQKNNLI